MIAIPLSAAEKMQIAVLDLIPKNTSKILSNAATDIIRSEMVKTGIFTIVERSQMDEILKEQGFQQSGCTDQSCAVQVGKLLSAKKILLGEINKIKDVFIITARIVDIEKGVSEFSANEKAESEEVLDKACKNLTDKLIQNIMEGNKEYFITKKIPAGYYIRGLVPGWAQYYSGNETKGYIVMGVFACSVGFLTYTVIDYYGKKSDYEDLKLGTPQSKVDSKYSDAEDAALLANIAAWTAVSIYLLNWIDLLFINDYIRTETAQHDSVRTYFSVYNINNHNSSDGFITNFAYNIMF